MVESGDCGVSREHEVAVHTMREEYSVVVGRGGRGDGEGGGGKALGYYCTTVDTAGAGRVPEFAGAVRGD